MVLKLFINLLILFFGFLLLMQIWDRNMKKGCVEGFEQTESSTPSKITYEEYAKDPLILGEQNAGNIEYLKQQIGDIPAVKTTLDSLVKRMDQLEEQMNNLTAQQNKAFQDLSGGSPPTTTGLE